ncbi:hypothetical protein SNE40_000941 [Patella caerulea]|uniref:Uncharacterized protein n=1 Tax=Patella caerulea TaxID=87958 RepID=A0AAN8KG41_PATCE
MFVGCFLILASCFSSGLTASLYKGIYDKIKQNSHLEDAIWRNYQDLGYGNSHFRLATPSWLDLDLDDIFNQIHDSIKGKYGEIPLALLQLLNNIAGWSSESAADLPTKEQRSDPVPERTDISLEDIFNKINDFIKGYATSNYLSFLIKREATNKNMDPRNK